MRVVVPYAGSPWRTEVGHALRAAGNPTFEWPDVSGSDRAYFDLLSELWRDGESVIVIEHDIIIHPTALDELSACPHDWCGFPHKYGNTITYGLGCVKFSAALIARNPDAMQRVGVMFDAHHEKRHWCRLDAWLQGCVLPGNGEVKCCHETVVGHLGSGCAHGCTTV